MMLLIVLWTISVCSFVVTMICYVYAGNVAKEDTHQTFHVYGRSSIYVINSVAWVAITLISIATGTPVQLNMIGEVTPQMLFTAVFVLMSVGSAIGILRFMHAIRKEQT